MTSSSGLVGRLQGEPWQNSAACRLHSAELFDLPDGPERRSRSFAARLTKARTICHGCPVFDRCRVEAFIDGGSGIRGGELFENGHPVEMEPAKPVGKFPVNTAVCVGKTAPRSVVA